MILESLYFFLPAYFANMAPVLLKWIPFGNKPVYERLLGKSKTWRGIIVAPIVGMLIFYIQKLLYLQGFQSLSLIDYADFSIMLGFLLGAGAILGDLVKSFFKRREGIEPGKPWFLWDQIDFVIGGLTLGFFVYVPRAEVVLVLFIASPILHIIFNHIGYLLGIRDVRF